jgi:hypothetical protein
LPNEFTVYDEEMKNDSQTQEEMQTSREEDAEEESKSVEFEVIGTKFSFELGGERFKERRQCQME